MFLISIFFLLQKNQDPYSILGCPRTASQAQIRSCFRVQTKKFHPDVNHDPEATKKFMLINDAYELLSDQEKREKYDKFGSIDERYIEHSEKDKISEYIKEIIRKENKIKSEGKKQVIEFENVKEMHNKIGNDNQWWIVGIVNEENKINVLNNVLEGIVNKLGSSVHVGIVVNNYKNDKLMLINNGKNIFLELKGFRNVDELLKLITDKINNKVEIINNDDDILKWRKQKSDLIHVITFSYLEYPPVSLKLVEILNRNIGTFAFCHIDQNTIHHYPRALGSLHLDEFPTTIIYRMSNHKDDTFGGIINPIYINIEVDTSLLNAIIMKHQYAIFPELNANNFNRICSKYCLIYISNGLEISDDIKIGINNMNIPTGLINQTKEKEFIHYFNLEPRDFIILKPNENKYLILKEIFTFTELRKKLEFMHHGILSFKKVETIPKLTTIYQEDFKTYSFSVTFQKIKDNFIVSLTYFITYLNHLPAKVILILIGLFLILIGEIFRILVLQRCFHKK